MQMIDVLKRLQELDANNSNIIKESSVEECGPMGMMPSQPKSPATINITADSGEELGSMLSAIMKLAGVNKVEPKHLGIEHEPTVMTAEPALGAYPIDGEVMHGSIDKMNPEIEDEGVVSGAGTGAAIGGIAGGLLGGPVGAGLGAATGSALGAAGGAVDNASGVAKSAASNPALAAALEGDNEPVDELADIKRLSGHSQQDNHGAKYDTTPNDPTDFEPFDAEEYSAHPNDGDGRGRIGTQPNAKTMEDQLMNEYKKFISEDWRDEVSGGSDFAFGVHNPNDARMTSPRGTGISAGGLGGGDDEEGDSDKPEVKKKEETPIVDKKELNRDLVNHAIKKFGPVVAKRNDWHQDENGNWFFAVRQGMKGEKLDSALLHMNMRYGKPGMPLVVKSKDMDIEKEGTDKKE